MLTARLWPGSLLLLASLGPALAQYPPLSRSEPPFIELSATADGKWLYFTSLKVLRRESEGTFEETRLYRFGPDGLTLFAQRGDLASKNTGSSNDGVVQPQVSADGSVVAFTFNTVCPAKRRCVQSQNLAQLRDAHGNLILDLGPDATVQLSRNGRYALFTSYALGGPPVPGEIQTVQESLALLDLQSGASVPIVTQGCAKYGCVQPDRALASDGSVLLFRGSEVGLWREGNFQPLPAVETNRFMILSDDARLILWPGWNITQLEIATGRETLVATNAKLLDLSSDSRYILYGHTPTGYGPIEGPPELLDTVTGHVDQLSLDPGEQANAGALGGSDVAFIATTTGRILKFTTATGTREALFPPAPECKLSNALVPGSLVDMACPDSLKVNDWTGRITLNDVEMKVLSASPSRVTFQVPWDKATAVFVPDLFRLRLPGDAPFRTESRVGVPPFLPEFRKAAPETNSFLGLQFFTEDWSGPLTAQPVAGQIIHAYLTGLGLVDGPMETGVPAPEGVKSPIREPLKCRFRPHSTDAETLDARLAPGLIGIYQATFRMPPETGNAPITAVSCSVPTSGVVGGVFGVQQ